MQTDAPALLPPYGPVEGTLRGIELIIRAAPSRVDPGVLRRQRVAPGNEYKVVGALRYLGLVDAVGQLTAAALALRGRGPTRTLALQETVRRAYVTVFERLDLRRATPADVYNHFALVEGLPPEMATKASRFFLGLCRWAQVPMSEPLASRSRAPRARPSRRRRPAAAPAPSSDVPTPITPLVLALTPEIAQLSEDELTGLFRKLASAWKRASGPTSP